MPRFEHVRAKIPCPVYGCELLHLSTPRWTDWRCRGRMSVSAPLYSLSRLVALCGGKNHAESHVDRGR
jgi:hypothetical protein